MSPCRSTVCPLSVREHMFHVTWHVSETCQKYSLYEWELLKRYSRSEVKCTFPAEGQPSSDVVRAAEATDQRCGVVEADLYVLYYTTSCVYAGHTLAVILCCSGRRLPGSVSQVAMCWWRCCVSESEIYSDTNTPPWLHLQQTLHYHTTIHQLTGSTWQDQVRDWHTYSTEINSSSIAHAS